MRPLYAVGYQASDHVIVQAGWVNQANYNQPTYKQGQFTPLTTVDKNNVVVQLTYKLAHRVGTPAPEKLPSQHD